MVRNTSFWSTAFGIASALAMIASPAAAQMRSVDPDKAIDADLSGARADPVTVPAAPVFSGVSSPTVDPVYPAAPAPAQGGPANDFSSATVATPQAGSTFHKDDLIGAAEGVFGKGSRGLAMMIEDILRKQGEPNGYIIGREGGGAFVVGLRYGSGTLHHKVEGQRPVYWTGPSIGFDAGANAGNAFVLVYNLYNTQDLYHRFGAGEGQAYLVGGFNVSYLRRGNIVLVPVRMGAGLRLGINAGYMKFSDKQKWLPF
jgi:hypothetical protein